MQAIFSLNTNQYINEKDATKHLTTSIDNYLNIYHYVLYTFLQVAEFVETDADIKANKFLPTDDDGEVNAKLLQNELVIALQESDELSKIAQKNKFKQFKEEHVIRSIYSKLNENEKYIAYLNNLISGQQDDLAIAKYIILKVVAKNDVFKKNLEDHFINFEDDFSSVKKTLSKQLKQAGKDNNFDSLVYEKDDYFTELLKFGEQLLAKTVDHSEFFEEQMESYLKNWETNRLALIDLILLKMALCELQFFSEIPVKVTMNEYIDISKVYSTPKSKDFINGVLDKMMKDLKQAGKINKTGRGLNN